MQRLLQNHQKIRRQNNQHHMWHMLQSFSQKPHQNQDSGRARSRGETSWKLDVLFLLHVITSTRADTSTSNRTGTRSAAKNCLRQDTMPKQYQKRRPQSTLWGMFQKLPQRMYRYSHENSPRCSSKQSWLMDMSNV